jgi:hypothetical protein
MTAGGLVFSLPYGNPIAFLGAIKLTRYVSDRYAKTTKTDRLEQKTQPTITHNTQKSGSVVSFQTWHRRSPSQLNLHLEKKDERFRLSLISFQPFFLSSPRSQLFFLCVEINEAVSRIVLGIMFPQSSAFFLSLPLKKK